MQNPEELKENLSQQDSVRKRAEEVLRNLNRFRVIEHARRVMEEWGVDYNETLPRSFTGFLTLKEFAEKEEGKFTGKL
jgi:hypothetical protein